MIAAVCDVETTGFTVPSISDLHKQPSIIEIGIVLVCDGEVIDSFGELVMPPDITAVDAVITKITGITHAMLEGKPRFAHYMPQLAALFSRADIFIAHNAPFDEACFHYEFKRLGEGVPLWWPSETLCSVQEYQHEFGHRPKLLELYERKLGRPLAQTHRALEDAQALAEILIHEGVI